MAEWQSTYWNTTRLSSLCCVHLIAFAVHLTLLVSITFAKTVLHRFRVTPGNWVRHHTSLTTGNWVRHHMLSTSLCTCFIHKLRTKRFTFGFRFLLTSATERKIPNVKSRIFSFIQFLRSWKSYQSEQVADLWWGIWGSCVIMFSSLTQLSRYSVGS